MRDKILLGLSLAGLTAAGVAFLQPAEAADPKAGKNIKVLTGMSLKQIRDYMKKTIKPGLGVDCDHCHDVNDMSVDTPKKETARQMIKMVNDVNKKYFAGKDRVTCTTCHGGNVKPK